MISHLKSYDKKHHISDTIKVLNKIDPDFIRIRTFLPKINTPILKEIKSEEFKILSPHEILKETYNLIKGLKVNSHIFSDHYTNYIKVNGELPKNKKKMLDIINQSYKLDGNAFRDVFIGTE